MPRRADQPGRVRRRTRAAAPARALVAGAALLLVLAACGSETSVEDPDAATAPGAASSSTSPDGGAGSSAVATAGEGGLDPALAVPTPGPLASRLESADLLVSAADTLSDATVEKIRDLPGVASVLQVGLAQVPVEGQALNVLSVDPATYRAWTPRGSATLQDVWDRVAGGEVAVSPTLDEKLVDQAGYLRLGSAEGSPEIHVGAFAPQVPFIDAVVNDKWGAELEIRPGSALVVSTSITAPSKVQKEVQEALAGQDISVQGLDVVARAGLDIGVTQQAFLVGSVADAVGTYRYTVLGGGRVAPDPAWVATHISTETVPILGSVTCNTKIFPQLKAALAEVVARGLADKIIPGQYAGCFYPRFIAGSNRLSNHAFGLALDLNTPGNQRGTVGQMDRGVVDAFKHWGFAWGGDWHYTDPMHFEMSALVNPGR